MTTQDTILVINAGSSSIKFTLFLDKAEPESFLKGTIEGLYTGSAHFVAHDTAGSIVSERRWSGTVQDHAGMTKYLLEFVKTHLGNHEIVAIGHRVVHGGSEYGAPVRLDEIVLSKLHRLVPLAPLHQPHNLAPVRSIFDFAPTIFQVACFDTAFHAGQPPIAQSFALPPDVTEKGVKRYGFHGLSYEFIASRMPSLDPALSNGKVVVAHLGNGASLCAIENGKSIASTMGFTALDGLPMGTRSGSIDPGVILYLIDELKMGPRDIENLLYRRSGLLGVSGISSDMRTLESSTDPRAKFAVELFVYRTVREVASLAAAMGGLDGLVFTAGIGEHSGKVRKAVSDGVAWMGLELDEEANTEGRVWISTSNSRVSAWKISTDEELMIARHTSRIRAAG